jgi:hypothetical protein
VGEDGDDQPAASARKLPEGSGAARRFGELLALTGSPEQAIQIDSVKYVGEVRQGPDQERTARR